MVILRWTIFDLDHSHHFLYVDQSSSWAIGEDGRSIFIDSGFAHAHHEAILPASPAYFHLAGIFLQCSVCFHSLAIWQFCGEVAAIGSSEIAYFENNKTNITIVSYLPNTDLISG